MFSPPKISWVVFWNKIDLLLVFYLIQPPSKQIICFDFQKQNSGLPMVFYVPCAQFPAKNRNVQVALVIGGFFIREFAYSWLANMY
jgi:hypothetical protein